MKQLGTVLGTFLLAICAACGTPTRDPGTGDDTGVDASGSDARHDAGTGIDGPQVDNSLVYAHSATVLYKVDATTFAPTEIAAFSGITGSVTDIAVDKNGAMVAITNSTLYSVNPATAAGSEIKALSGAATNFTGLGYVPDPQDTTKDLLVTANASGDVYTIDPTTGQSTKVGNYGKLNGKQISSSGDLFGVRGFGTYASVKVAGSTNDFLARIDTSTWAATPLGGVSGTGFKNIFGLGFWAGKVFGFDDAGNVIAIDKDSGLGMSMEANATVWWGAGVTTNAPIIQ